MNNQPAEGIAGVDKSGAHHRGTMIAEPADVAAREMFAFVIESLPTDCQRIVEAGCGDGRLAAMLNERRMRVVAVDQSAESVEIARSRGVDATCRDWNDFRDGVFDAVLFTRSLHHMADPRRAVQHALEMLRNEGRVIVDDFAFELVSKADINWFSSYTRATVLTQCNGVPPDDTLIASLLSSPNLRTWTQHHHPGIHDYAVIRRAVVEDGSPVLEQSTPYLYRYLLDWLKTEPNGLAIAEAALVAEVEMIERGKITPVGRQLVVSK